MLKDILEITVSSHLPAHALHKGASKRVQHMHMFFLAHARTVVLAKQLGQRTCVVCSNGHM